MFLKKMSLILISIISTTILSSFSFSRQVAPSGYGQMHVIAQPIQPGYSNLFVAPQPQLQPLPIAPPSQPGYSNLFVNPQPQLQPQPLPLPIAPPGQANSGKLCVNMAKPRAQTNKKERAKLAKFVDRDRYIWFYDKHNKYTYFLSNFYPSPIQIWGMNFLCAEAAFQAAKFADKPQLMAHFTRLDGEAAKKFAERFGSAQRTDWYSVREAMMLEVLRNKFRQNSELKNLLLCTGDAYLVEHTKKDSFWADGGKGKGKNRLGQLLMQVRGEMGGFGAINKPPQYRKFVH